MRKVCAAILITLLTSTFAHAQISARFDGAQGGAVIIGDSTTTCDTSIEGALRYSNPLAEGLVAHWKLDEGSGTDAGDSAGSFDGVFQGTPAWTTGQDGGAVDFNDNADYIEIADDPALDGFSAITLAAWINPQGEPGASHGRIIHKSYTATNDVYSIDHVPASYRIRFRVTTTVEGTVDFQSETTIAPSTGWHHVVGVWDGKNMAVFIDGHIVAKYSGTSRATGNLITTADNVGIGRHTQTNTRNFDGYIDDARIYNRALSAKEIHALYVATGGTDWAGTCSATKCGGQSGERVVFRGGWSLSAEAGSIAGIYGADAWCQYEAEATGLEGDYKAWIADSDASSAPASRLEQAIVPYVMPDGTQVADDWSDLTDGTIDNNISIAPDGGDYGGTPNTATNVDTDGTQYSATNHCNDWSTTSSSTARYGWNSETDSGWTSNSNPQCNHPVRLYCFEQPVSGGGGASALQFCDGTNWVDWGG